MVILCLQTKKNSNEVFATFKNEHYYPSPLLMFYSGLRMVKYRGENTLTFSQEKSLRKHADINFDNSSYAFLLNLTFQHLVVLFFSNTVCLQSDLFRIRKLKHNSYCNNFSSKPCLRSLKASMNFFIYMQGIRYAQ